jgi:hypothetical protein
MPALSAPQKQQVADWVNEGLSLSDIQKKITAELGVHMTYMDVRFLVDDLDLTLKDKEQPKPVEPAKDEAPAASTPESTPPGAAPAAGNVRISIDPIQRPGVLVGGSVTFTDGQTGQWQMDANGQLGFVPPFAGYKPAPADVQQFQVVLDEELRKLGY